MLKVPPMPLKCFGLPPCTLSKRKQLNNVEHKKTDAAHVTFIFGKCLLTGKMPLDATAKGGFPFTSMFNFHFRDTKRGLFQPHGVAC